MTARFRMFVPSPELVDAEEWKPPSESRRARALDLLEAASALTDYQNARCSQVLRGAGLSTLADAIDNWVFMTGGPGVTPREEME